jgi:hypothetical protein
MHIREATNRSLCQSGAYAPLIYLTQHKYCTVWLFCHGCCGARGGNITSSVGEQCVVLWVYEDADKSHDDSWLTGPFTSYTCRQLPFYLKQRSPNCEALPGGGGVRDLVVCVRHLFWTKCRRKKKIYILVDTLLGWNMKLDLFHNLNFNTVYINLEKVLFISWTSTTSYTWLTSVVAPQISFLNFELEICRSICQICLLEFILVGGGAWN